MAVIAIISAAGCTGVETPSPAQFDAPDAAYLSNDLISVTVAFSGEPALSEVRRVTDCAAARAILPRGDSFLRHVRTSRVEEGGISRADAVYSVSKQLPAGAFVLDAEVVAENCRTEGTLGV